MKVRATMSVWEEAMAYEDVRVESLIIWLRASNLELDFPFEGRYRGHIFLLCVDT